MTGGSATIPRRSRTAIVEWLLALLILASIVRAYLLLRRDGFLPPPFFFNYFDSLMDGYNTALWSFRNGAYDVWGTVYPPMSFVWFKVFALPHCYAGTDVAARDCDWWLRTWFVVLLLGNLVLVWATYRRRDPATAIPRAIAVGLGMPMLYALERANLIVPAFTFFALAFGPLLATARLRWFSAAMAANFKPYLIAAIFAVLLRRKWRWFEGAVLACVLVYLLSWIVVRDGTPVQIVRNMILFADPSRSAEWPVSWYASSYIPLRAFIAANHAPLVRLLGTGPLDVVAWLLPALMRGSQMLAILAAVAIWLRPGLFPATRGAAIAIMFALSAQETGGYGVCFALYLVFFEEARGPCRIAALAIAYLLALCADLVLAPLDFRLVTESYLGGGPATASWGLTLGTLVRPAGLLVTMDLLSIATIARLASTSIAEGRLSLPWRGKDGSDQPSLPERAASQ